MKYILRFCLLCSISALSIATAQISLDAQGNLSVSSATAGVNCTGCAGVLQLSGGAAQLNQPANSFWLTAPAVVTPYVWTVPPTQGTGYLYSTNGILSYQSGPTGGGATGGSPSPCNASVTVATAQPSVTFSNIPATCRDLFITIQARSDGVGTYPTDAIYLSFNGDSNNDYDWELMSNLGNSPVNTGKSSIQICILLLSGSTPNYASACTISIPNYAGTVFQKSTISHSGGRYNTSGGTYVGDVVGEWSGVVAINSLTIIAGIGNFVPGSTISLWGAQ